MPDLVAEQRVVPARTADDRLRIGIKQQLVRVEAVSSGRVVGSMHAIGVQQSGPRFRQVAVPDLVCVFRQLQSLDLAPAAGIEEAQLDLFGVLGKEREVNALPVPMSAAQVG